MQKYRIVKFSTAALLAAVFASESSAQFSIGTKTNEVNTTGATLFRGFFEANAQGNDAIDLDGDGVVTDLSVPTLDNVFGSTFNVQSRGIGSGNGFQELVDLGYNNGAGAAWSSGNYNSNDYATLNSVAATPSSSFTGDVYFDMSAVDVPSAWFVTDTRAGAKWDNSPFDNTGNAPRAGYGNNAIQSNINIFSEGGTGAAGQSQKLKSLTPTGGGGTTLNLNQGNPDAQTLFDTEIAWTPIGVFANYGAQVDSNGSAAGGEGEVRKTTLQHGYVTGRTETGENLGFVARDSGSGTRNGFANSIGVDPSWAGGDNVGQKNGSGDSQFDRLGPEFQPTHKGGSSRMEGTVQNFRLAVGYSGLADGLGSNSRAGDDSVDGDYQLLAVGNDTMADWLNSYVFPKLGTSVANASSNNVVFNGDPNAALAGTPGDFLAQSFALVPAVEALPDTSDTDQFVANGDFSPALSGPGGVYDLDPSLLPTDNITTGYGPTASNGNRYGKYSDRTDISGGGFSVTTYTDGTDGTVGYIANDGTVLTEGGSMFAGNAYADRNAIAGDFDDDGDRDKDDIASMVNAYENSGAKGAAAAVDAFGNTINSRDALAAGDAEASLELLGDFNGDGSFTAEDVRYGADGLFNQGRSGEQLDRKQNFIDVDNASTSGNLFATTLATGKAYAAGDSRGDVAGSGFQARGWAPQGFDGTVDAQDIDYVFDQFVGNSFVTDGVANWADLDEAAGFDLSADMDGDLDVDQDDVTELVTEILGTFFGDANLTGEVDFLDVSIISANFNQTGVGWAQGDFNGDGVVDFLDVSIVSVNFNAGVGAAAEAFASFGIDASSVIPEPTTFVFTALGGLTLIGRRRSSRRA
ncbi:hypothetical protein [Algisphaera agarilytica]|uniref:PEP-CTERM protein-sorting domain-containing protein n=1 Tax=Algisphaera agarilytica TaxID=1385975 RepID=A0A7X0H6L0_9BACT|nr:hypothetical protein [Algisphaera agarilytica]MBB6430078.1 hypothetical protein [Algisphaera agarilytica]